MKMTLDEATALAVNDPNHFKWDGWTLVYQEPNAAGFMKVNGAWVNDEWHIQKRIEVGDDGTYDVPRRLINNGLSNKMGT